MSEPEPSMITILVVDDSPTQLAGLEFLLEEAGYRVVTAGDGVAGLAAARAQTVNVVISDVIMPEMDGYEFCRALRNDPTLRHLPVVLLTSLNEPQDVIRGLEAGADNFIRKPYQDETLLARLRNMLVNRELRRSSSGEQGIPVAFADRHFLIRADRLQILDLLLSNYEDTVEYNAQLVHAQEQLCELNEELEGRVLERTAALAQSEVKYRALVESSPDALFVIGPGPGFPILEANRVAAEVYGYSHEELLDLSAIQLCAPNEDAEVSDLLQWASQGMISVESSHLTRDGRVFPVEAKTRSFDFAGQPCVLASVRDISERRLAETERRRLEEHLQASQRIESVGLLAGGVAHDFNNLLSVILSYTGLALETIGDGPIAADLREVHMAAERAADLTHRLLAFSRKQVLQPMPLSLNRVIEGFEKMLRRLLPEDIHMVKILQPDLPLINADPSQMEGVLMNLVVNARDAMPTGGTLTIRTAEAEFTRNPAVRAGGELSPGSYVRLEVTDTGCGMDKEVLARIMEPFFTTKEVGKGTGLGLATVHGVITQSGGGIQVQSEPGRGSTFTILLPVTNATAPEVKSPVKKGNNEGGDGTILVAEDEKSIRSLIYRILTRAGYTVLTAADGKEALKLHSQHPSPIQLLLTDVVMPGMGGVALAEQIVERQDDLKVIFMSGYSGDSLVRHGALIEGTHFLSKPFTPDILRQKVREVLDTDDFASLHPQRSR